MAFASVAFTTASKTARDFSFSKNQEPFDSKQLFALGGDCSSKGRIKECGS